MQRQQTMVWLIIATIIWFGLSWYWYTCTIKGFCDFVTNTPEVTIVDRDEVTVGNSQSQGSNSTRREVVTESEEIIVSCDSYLDSYIRLGYNNQQSDVIRLQEFLNTYEGESLDVDGQYSTEDVAAVNRFQEKYRAQVLDPYGIAQPTGYVFKTTRDQINTLQCAFQYAVNNN